MLLNLIVRTSASAILICLVLALSACGGEDEKAGPAGASSTSEEKVTTEESDVETDAPSEPEHPPQTELEPSQSEADDEPVAPPPAHEETADLPLCTEGSPPCRLKDGSVQDSGGAESGESADLPLCSSGPPPCRQPDGAVVEP